MKTKAHYIRKMAFLLYMREKLTGLGRRDVASSKNHNGSQRHYRTKGRNTEVPSIKPPIVNVMRRVEFSEGFVCQARRLIKISAMLYRVAPKS